VIAPEPASQDNNQDNRYSRLVRLLTLAAVFTAASYLFQVAIACATRFSAGEGIGIDVFAIDPFDWHDIRGAAPVPAILLLELILVGWHQSSLRRLLCAPSASAMTDWAFLMLMASGLYSALIIVGGLGVFAYLSHQATGWTGLALFTDWPLWAALPVLYLIRSFYAYWLHRLQHSPWLWPLHKTHHAAHEFTTLNYLRAHPIELAWQTLAHTIALAAIGFPIDAIILFEVLANTQQFLNHSNATALAPLERLGVVTPAGHRVHHGLDERFHHRNFGELLNLWDRVFGTYVVPPRDIQRLAIGVPEGGIAYNSDGLVRGLWAQSVEWGRAVRDLCAASFALRNAR
jgi:sterol desaturase/sphingolipid hydroxylase (fatty acid hydroxylase superfamily)